MAADSESAAVSVGDPTQLRVHALFRLAEIEGDLPGVARVERLPDEASTEVYHDTDDLRLFRWSVTLRRYEGGDDRGWRLRLPEPFSDPRAAEEIAKDQDGTDVPEEFADLVMPLVRERPLRAVATLRTERTPYLLRDADGEPVAELVDDTVSVLDGDHVAARFRELEVRAAAGADPQIAAAIVEVLLEQGAVPGKVSKAASALGPRASAPPDVVLRGSVSPEDPAADAVRAHIALQVSRLLAQDVRVRRDLPDSVHQMRVAARRLRSGLKVFAPLLALEWADALRVELGWAAGELGRVRDTEVMLSRLHDHADELPPADAQLATAVVERVLKAELARAREEALASLRSQRHRDLLVSLVEAVHRPQLSELANEPCAEVLPPRVHKAFKRLHRDVRALHIDSVAEPWHETRIAGKKARYAAELVVPVFGDPAKHLARALSEVTEVLGDHQDCHVAEQELRRIARLDDVDGPTGFALGLLHAAEEERELSLREDFVVLWPRVLKTYRNTVLV